MPGTILVIDDDQDIVWGLTRLLHHEGYATLSAENGTAGLELAQQQSPDLIVCDVMMPGPNGFALKALLAQDQATAKIPFIFLTARTEQLDKFDGFALGADDYITKPFDRSELLLRIHAVLQRQELGRQLGWQQAQRQIDLLKQEMRRNFKDGSPSRLTSALDLFEAILQRGYANSPEKIQELLTRVSGKPEWQRLIQDLISLGELHPAPASERGQFIELEIDFLWPLQACFEKYAYKQIIPSIILEPDQKNWASIFRPLDYEQDFVIATRLIIQAPPDSFTRAVIQLTEYACLTSHPNGHIQAVLAPNGIGGCIFTLAQERPVGVSTFPDPELENNSKAAVTPQVTPAQTKFMSARAWARQMGGDVTFWDTPTAYSIQLILPPHPHEVTPAE